MSGDTYRQQIVISVPSPRADEIEDAVESALGNAGVLDGAGHDGEATELFVYGPDLEPLLDALLAVDYPKGARAHVTATDIDARSETTMQVHLVGNRKGRRSKVRTRQLAGSVGDLVVCDLGDGDGYVAARLSHVTKWFVIAWFFPGIHVSIPDRRVFGRLRSRDALVALRCSRHEVAGPPWAVLGPFEPFNQAEWPLPELERVFSPTGAHYAVRLNPKVLDQERAWVIDESEWWQRAPDVTFDQRHYLRSFLKLAMTDLGAALRYDWEGRPPEPNPPPVTNSDQ